jgi:hypothetical protein
VQAIGLHESAEEINATLVQGSSSAILGISCWRKTCHAHALCSTELLDSGSIFVELIMEALPDSGSVPVVTIAAKARLCNRSVEASSVRALDRRRISRSHSICHRGVIGVSSICPETCERHVGAIVSIQKALSEDAIRTPSKMDSSALPGAQKGDSTSLKWGQGVGCSGDRGPLADHDGPGPGPGIEPRGIGVLGGPRGRGSSVRVDLGGQPPRSTRPKEMKYQEFSP